MTQFHWRELTHTMHGGRVAGCYAWHYHDAPLCDHEHGVDDPTCEDTYAEMARIRASAPENVEEP